ncbi:MAG: hypothetical protein IJU33_08480 [Bacteroidales bacterium]|nr:hypothetical protein [Bacteroidales bacterium]
MLKTSSSTAFCGARGLFGLLVVMGLFCLVGCHPKEETFEDALTLKFLFTVDGDHFMPGEGYVNAAGNVYEIQEIKFFISDVRLIKNSGEEVKVLDDESIHYVDYDIPATLSWKLHKPLPAGEYKALAFTFGLSEKDNVSHRFPNPPESNMSWPETLGGGYHYMQINGKWQSAGEMKPFNLHTGIGQVKLGKETEYVHNDFQVILPFSECEPLTPCVISATPVTVNVWMNINNWFTSPRDYDFEVFGGSIMQNQEAQQIIKENGHDVFSAFGGSYTSN